VKTATQFKLFLGIALGIVAYQAVQGFDRFNWKPIAQAERVAQAR
jgi:hypothetical protein